jgi:hypothetical protein
MVTGSEPLSRTSYDFFGLRGKFGLLGASDPILTLIHETSALCDSLHGLGTREVQVHRPDGLGPLRKDRPGRRVPDR